MKEFIKQMLEIERIEQEKSRIEEENSKELTAREWHLIYDAIERRLYQLEELSIKFQDDKRIKAVEDTIEELDAILCKVGPKTIQGGN